MSTITPGRDADQPVGDIDADEVTPNAGDDAAVDENGDELDDATDAD